MNNKFNIVIPSIKLSNELKFTLNKLNRLNHKNFFVTIVLNKKNFTKKLKYNYPLKIIISNKINMSAKRNLAVKRYFSKYVAFLDSDAYPNKDWLKNAEDLIEKKVANVVGGPSIPFENQSYFEMIAYQSKRSFFLTGNLYFRKYKSKSRYCDWLESCNFFITRKDYLKYGGMNEKIFLGEDKNFFEKCIKQNKNFKTFFSPTLFIYHKERSYIKFLLQRFSFGLDVINIMNFQNKINSYLPLLPFIVFFGFLSFAIFEYKLSNSVQLTFYSFLGIQIIILISLLKYLSRIDKIFFTLLTINLANIFYALGSLLKFIKIEKYFQKNIYRLSRSND